MSCFKPEGAIFDLPETRRAFSSPAALQEAFAAGRTLESRAIVCDEQHNLIVEMGSWRGVIPRAEGALGIIEGETRDIAIISRVNKPVCYKITALPRSDSGAIIPQLSRRAAQQECLEEYITRLTPGDVVDARVTRLDSFGCFVDIGCGIPSLIPIDAISVSRISHPGDRFVPGQEIKAVVKSVENGRVSLSHRELLGTWEQNAAMFCPGRTVPGVVRSVESYGIFVELTPNLAGLAEPREGVKPGQQACVYIKALIPEKMKIKLIIVDAFDAPANVTPAPYFIPGCHIDRWRYSPSCSPRVIETIFTPPGKNG